MQRKFLSFKLFHNPKRTPVGQDVRANVCWGDDLLDSFLFRATSVVVLLSLILTSAIPVDAHSPWEEEALPPTHVIADHVVISEVQIESGCANNEFVELYNPTGQKITFVGWKLEKRTSTGSNQNLATNVSGEILPFGFFVISPRPADISCIKSVIPDSEYTQGANFLAIHNAVVLYDEFGSPLDTVGWGSVPNKSGLSDAYETSAFSLNPSGGESLERKAFYFSSSSKMSGEHKNYGNSYDTHDNSQDFVLQTAPTPQTHSANATERCCTTVAGTLTQQGRTNHTGTAVLLWPGSGLRTTTNSSGQFSISNVPAVASEDTTEYSVEAAFAGYLSVQANLDLTSAPLPIAVTYSALKLLAGDINGDNQVNIFDLAIIGGQYGNIGAFLGDVNGDGKVNIQDLSLVSGNFGQESGQYNWNP